MYSNRSEAIRDLIRDFLIRDDLDIEDGEAVGSISIIYDHDTKGVSDKLTKMQHQDFTKVISSLHLHLTHELCMEIVAVKGSAKDIKKISDRLISSKGVKHGKLMLTSHEEIA